MNPSHLEHVYHSYPLSIDPSNTQGPGICAHLLYLESYSQPSQLPLLCQHCSR